MTVCYSIATLAKTRNLVHKEYSRGRMNFRFDTASSLNGFWLNKYKCTEFIQFSSFFFCISIYKCTFLHKYNTYKYINLLCVGPNWMLKFQYRIVSQAILSNKLVSNIIVYVLPGACHGRLVLQIESGRRKQRNFTFYRVIILSFKSPIQDSIQN